MVVTLDRKMKTKKLLDYLFQFIDFIEPLTSEGRILDFYPQEKYAKKEQVRLNKYGGGAFCKFRINPKGIGVSGVYALFRDNDLLYIGKCVNLAKRFNSGYGNISPKNCYEGGQSTNCRINKMIHLLCDDIQKISLYFYPTSYQSEIEKELINYYKPKNNISMINEKQIK